MPADDACAVGARDAGRRGADGSQRGYHARMLAWLVLGGVILTAALLLGAITTFAAPATTRGQLLLALAALAASLTLSMAVVALAG